MLHFAIFWALALFLSVCHAEPQATLIQNNNKGEQVVKMEAGETFKAGDKSVKTKMFPNSDFESEFYCKESLGKQLTATADGSYVGCCLPNQILVGSEDTQFMCCGKGHIMAGSKDVGFSCCPEGQTFDGKLCQAAAPTCDNGKELVGGKCVCPKGQSEASDGTCQKPQEQCKSDISYGKCYMFQFHNGEFFGADNGGTYYAYPADIYHGNGVFTFCQDEKCEGRGPIGANDSFYIKDNRGTPPSGVNAGWFLGNDQNGGHVYKRNNVDSYGEFTIAKFPDCNKYCLGGKKYGVYYACPSTTPAITFWTNDPLVCIPIELVEVQCDFHKDASNCAWQGGCNKNKLSGPPTPPHMDL